MKKNLLIFLLISHLSIAQDGTIFEPIIPQKRIEALKITENLTINGRLDEEVWQLAKPATGFFRQLPDQGGKPAFDSKAWVLFNKKNLYVGFFCPDTMGKKAVRVPDMQRDFGYFDYDLVGISLDPFNDKRNAVAFQTNPHGAQRDLLCFDDTFFDREWDGFWKVRTTRTDSGWVAEMQIPWATIRYPKTGKQDWGVQFVRRTRRLGEQSSWSPFPRAYTAYRMNYAGILKGIEPPLPSINIRVQPYLLTNYVRNYVDGSLQKEDFNPQIGGEIKWAITPSTILDLTFNTDFAQADADRQVQNLTRFSVFFPERRQFFLENASLFNIGQESQIQPFFSRSIGLANGNPIPLDAGIRLISRNLKQNIGALMVSQRESGASPSTIFGLLRYSRNVGKQNRFGGMITTKQEAALGTNVSNTNITYSADGFVRFSDPFSWNFMISGSSDAGQISQNGYTAYSSLNYESNTLSFYYNQSIISENYNPAMGFIYSSNIINTYFGGYRINRPKWKPKFIRQIDPGVDFDIYHRANDGKFLQAEIKTFPLYSIFVNGGSIEGWIVPTWQNLDEPQEFVGMKVNEGNYFYNRIWFNYYSDKSKKFSYALETEFGKFYDGNLTVFAPEMRYSPIPHVSMSLKYTLNSFKDLGADKISKNTYLLTPEVRLALNPRFQLTGFYQYNSAATRDVYNIRLAWEFQPLSFLYIVYNSNATQRYSNELKRTELYRNEQTIVKLTYLKQF